MVQAVVRACIETTHTYTSCCMPSIALYFNNSPHIQNSFYRSVVRTRVKRDYIRLNFESCDLQCNTTHFGALSYI